METLHLEKFNDAKLENLQMIAGGDGDTRHTDLDGTRRADYQDGCTLLIFEGDEVYREAEIC